MDLLLPDPPLEARRYAMLCHCAALTGCFLPGLGHIAGPLIAWLWTRNEDPYVDEQGKESLNFQISLLLYFITLSIPLAMSWIGFAAVGLLFALLYLASLLGIMAASARTKAGHPFRYPLTLRLIR